MGKFKKTATKPPTSNSLLRSDQNCCLQLGVTVTQCNTYQRWENWSKPSLAKPSPHPVRFGWSSTILPRPWGPDFKLDCVLIGMTRDFWGYIIATWWSFPCNQYPQTPWFSTGCNHFGCPSLGISWNRGICSTTNHPPNQAFKNNSKATSHYNGHDHFHKWTASWLSGWGLHPPCKHQPAFHLTWLKPGTFSATFWRAMFCTREALCPKRKALSDSPAFSVCMEAVIITSGSQNMLEPCETNDMKISVLCLDFS